MIQCHKTWNKVLYVPQLKKDEILKAAQKTTLFGKDFENRAGTKGTLLASFVSLIVGLIAVAMTASSVQLLYEGIRIKTIWKIIADSIETIVALFFILGFIGQVIS